MKLIVGLWDFPVPQPLIQLAQWDSCSLLGSMHYKDNHISK